MVRAVTITWTTSRARWAFTSSIPATIGPKPDSTKPQVLLYEPVGDKLVLVGAEWFVPVANLEDARRRCSASTMMGPMEGHQPIMTEDLHHWDLHVWLWKDNPNGVFNATNPEREVSEDGLRIFVRRSSAEDREAIVGWCSARRFFVVACWRCVAKGWRPFRCLRPYRRNCWQYGLRSPCRPQPFVRLGTHLKRRAGGVWSGGPVRTLTAYRAYRARSA